MLLLGQMSFTPLMAFESFVVKEIRIEGIQRVSKDAVLQDLTIHVGDNVTAEKTSAAIHALFKSGFYKDVALERDGNTLIVKLVERPSIGKLELVGLKNKDEVNKVLKDNNVAEGRVYDPNVISKVEKEIIRNYLMKQRYGVKVESKVTNQERNRVAVEMRIYEGDIATIKEIKFVGNEAFAAKELRAQMHHKTKNWLSWFDKSDHYSKEKLAADLENIRSFYMDRGYLNFKIDSTQVSLSVDKKHVYLTINITEGQQFFFKNISLSGDMVVPREQLQTIVDQKLKSGAVCSRKSIWEVKDALEERLGEDGYSKAAVRLVDEIDQEQRLFNLKIYIDANKRILVRRITFTGNTLTEDKVLRRELEQFEGSWISTKKVKEGKEAIMRDSYASNIDIETVPVLDKDDQVDLVYKIEEQRTANVSAGIAYSGAERFSINLGADLKNFVGSGKDINFLFNHGKAQQSYTLGYSNPYFTESGVGMAYNLYRQKTRLSKTSTVFDYAVNSTGINLGWQFRISQYNIFRAGGGYDHSIIKMNYATAPLEAKSFGRAYNNNLGFKEYFVNFGWAHNSLDAYMFPNKGLTQGLDFKVSTPGSSLKLYKIDYDISWFRPLVSSYVLNLRADLGYSDSYNHKPFPFFKHYYLGGGDSVRGFEERSLGPKSSTGEPFGGNTLVQMRAQLIFPPPFFKDTKTVRTALFLDAGQVYDTHNKKTVLGARRNPAGLRYSAGVGLTWNTPLGVPVVFSLAWPLQQKYGDQRDVFAFSLGTQF